jgi:hypothetical protein
LRGSDLSAKNPNTKNAHEQRSAFEFLQGVKAKQERIAELLGELETLLTEGK